MSQPQYYKDLSILKQVSAYSILGVNEDATLEEIQSTYQQRVMNLQQDLYVSNNELKRVYLSYLILSNPQLKQRYDNKLLQVKFALFQLSNNSLQLSIKKFLESQQIDVRSQEQREETIYKDNTPMQCSPDWTQEFSFPPQTQVTYLTDILTSCKQELTQNTILPSTNDEIQRCSQLLHQYKCRILHSKVLKKSRTIKKQKQNNTKNIKARRSKRIVKKNQKL